MKMKSDVAMASDFLIGKEILKTVSSPLHMSL
jgi:hypothetical protein